MGRGQETDGADSEAAAQTEETAWPAPGIAVLHFGAQYGQLIARRVREAKVYCRVLPAATPPEELADPAIQGIILTGGPDSVYDDDAPAAAAELLEQDLPVLGICYGMQWMAYMLDGRVEAAPAQEYGSARLEVGDAGEGHPLLEGVPDGGRVWMSHADRVEEPPPGFTALARTDNTPVTVMAHRERPLYGVQFHPEVVHTDGGRRLLHNFLVHIAGCVPEWEMESFVKRQKARIQEQVGDGGLLCAVSGGVDSTVAATLVHRAVGDRLRGIFVDHGLLRQGEPDEVRRLCDRMGIPVTSLHRRQLFLDRLRGVADPEEKRRIIGETFIEVFEGAAQRFDDVRYLVQGTIYSDVVESGAPGTALIKSHHNVGGLPERMALDLLEPLRELFKDEVRRVGRSLELPETSIQRQPFPGPGLAVRIVGEVTQERLDILRRADAVVRDVLQRTGVWEEAWQAFAVLPAVTTVGVKGDRRQDGYPIVLRAVDSADGMTADWVRMPDSVLEQVSNRVTGEVPEVTRVVYDVTSKPPGTIEWE